MSKENYLLKESITESVVRLYEANGGVVAIGPSAHRMEKLTGGKYKASRHRVKEAWEEPAIYIPTEELLKNYATQLVAGDEVGVYTVADAAFDSAQAPDSALVAERSRSLAPAGEVTGDSGHPLTAGLVNPAFEWPKNVREDDQQRPPTGEGANFEEIHEMHYLQEEGDGAPILKPYVIKPTK
jgi:hypothetical protein